nr:unnamed protein product [Spirometra erinaceieuropaei]
MKMKVVVAPVDIVCGNLQMGLESSRSPAQHETEGVQGRHPPDADVWGRDLDGVHEAGTPTQRLPPQLSSPHTEAEAAGPNLRHWRTEATVILSIYAVLRQLQLRWSGHLMRMDDERPPRRLFYGDVATNSRRQGGQAHR